MEAQRNSNSFGRTCCQSFLFDMFAMFLCMSAFGSPGYPPAQPLDLAISIIIAIANTTKLLFTVSICYSSHL